MRDEDDQDRVAILRRRRRLVALALAGLTLSAPTVAAQPDATTSEDGGVGDGGAEPQVCLCAVVAPRR